MSQEYLKKLELQINDSKGKIEEYTGMLVKAFGEEKPNTFLINMLEKAKKEELAALRQKEKEELAALRQKELAALRLIENEQLAAQRLKENEQLAALRLKETEQLAALRLKEKEQLARHKEKEELYARQKEVSLKIEILKSRRLEILRKNDRDAGDEQELAVISSDLSRLEFDLKGN